MTTTASKTTTSARISKITYSDNSLSWILQLGDDFIPPYETLAELLDDLESVLSDEGEEE